MVRARPAYGLFGMGDDDRRPARFPLPPDGDGLPESGRLRGEDVHGAHADRPCHEREQVDGVEAERGIGVDDGPACRGAGGLARVPAPSAAADAQEDLTEVDRRAPGRPEVQGHPLAGRPVLGEQVRFQRGQRAGAEVEREALVEHFGAQLPERFRDLGDPQAELLLGRLVAVVGSGHGVTVGTGAARW